MEPSMKKDLSQPFEIEALNVFLFIENRKNHTFALLHSGDDNEYYTVGDVYQLPRIDVLIDSDMANDLIRVAREYGLSLTSFREIARETILQYSFIDDTPGMKHDTVCMLLEGEPIDAAQPHDGVVFMDIQKAQELLDPWTSRFVKEELKKYAERNPKV
jgi:hypothetical protein